FGSSPSAWSPNKEGSNMRRDKSPVAPNSSKVWAGAAISLFPCGIERIERARCLGVDLFEARIAQAAVPGDGHRVKIFSLPHKQGDGPRSALRIPDRLFEILVAISM